MSLLLCSIRNPGWKVTLDHNYRSQMQERGLSTSLLSGLLVLSRFPADGSYLGVAELARMLSMNSSTTHRYAVTLLAAGLLERDTTTRKYRLAGPR